jgi:hypothetical protein
MKDGTCAGRSGDPPSCGFARHRTGTVFRCPITVTTYLLLTRTEEFGKI